MDLESDIIDEMGQQMANEMDQHILIGFMLELGWHEVVVDPWQHSSLGAIQHWVKDTVVNPHMHTGNRWVFEDEKDAIIFALKWE